MPATYRRATGKFPWPVNDCSLLTLHSTLEEKSWFFKRKRRIFSCRADCSYSEVDPLPSREVSTDGLPANRQIVTNRSCLHRQRAHVSRRGIMVTAIQTQRKRV